MTPAEEWFLAQFMRLSTERQIGMAIGPIPHSKIEDAADRAGLDFELRALFFDVVAVLDNWFVREETARIDQASAEARAQAAAAAANPGGG